MDSTCIVISIIKSFYTLFIVFILEQNLLKDHTHIYILIFLNFD
jgi:hypothetical protein